MITSRVHLVEQTRVVDGLLYAAHAPRTALGPHVDPVAVTLVEEGPPLPAHFRHQVVAPACSPIAHHPSQGKLQNAPTPPVGSQYSCQPTVKLHVLPH